MNKVCIFGGSFNPVTNAHVRLADYIADNLMPVWFMPCRKSLYNKDLAPGNDRFNMLLKATERHFIFDWEFAHENESGTLNICEKIAAEHPKIEFYFVIGLDNALKVHTWKRGDEIKEKVRFIVAPRGGYESASDWFKNEPHIYLKDYVPELLSSTEVRGLIKDGDPGVSNLISPTVLNYIRERGLYA